ncbi:hypothetical protein AD998_11640 [bacterium 336/3]|nr:hypothetical protein AD998_11640 [bacterium 336/3]
MYEYTTNDTLLLKEYGRNVQKLVEYILTIENREERTQKANLIVELMKQIHPNYKEVQDIPSKFWDDLFIISKFQLDVDAPFPMPEKDALGKSPQKVEYSTNHIKFKHYGKNIQLLVQTIGKMPLDEKRKELEVYLFKMLKSFYQAWQKENIEDVVLIEHIKEISDNTIRIALEDVAGDKGSVENKMKLKPNQQFYSNNPNFKNNKSKKNQFNKNKNKNRNPNQNRNNNNNGNHNK